MILYFLLLFLQIITITYFWKNIPSFILSAYIISMLGLFIRPMIYFITNKFNYHIVELDVNTYLNSLYILLFVSSITILIFYKGKDPFKDFLLTYKVRGEYNFFIMIIVIILSLMFFLSGDLWLSVNRVSSISTTMPILRYLYPAALFSATVLIIIVVNQLIKNKKLSFHLILLLFISMSTFLLISQRGFMIVIALCFLIAALNLKLISFKGFFTFISILIFYGLFSRILMMENVNIWDALNLVFNRFAEGGNGTENDSLSSLILYLNNRDIKFTLTNEFLSFLSHRTRIDSGLMNTTDIINTYILGDFYYEFGFGFNFTNIHMYILNFGIIIGLFFYTTSLIVARIILDKFTNNINGNAYEIFLFYLLFLFLITSYASIHWLIYFYCMTLVYRFSKILFFSKKIIRNF